MTPARNAVILLRPMKIELQGVSKNYGRSVALDDVTLEIAPGQLVALLGPNGAGKTTMLRCLAGIVAPNKGRLRYDGQPFTRDRLDMRRRFSFLPDFPVVFEEWPVLRHIGMMLRLYESDGPGIEEKVIEVLAELEMLPLAEKPFNALSRGQRYKGALAALMAADPEIWLLDEPFASGMDPHGITAFKRRARDAVSRGRTVIYSTQILDAAEHFSDRVCIIYRGCIAAFDSVANLRDQSLPTGSVLENMFDILRDQTTT
jgi:ABC-2 type transport system ATP-binding protein